MERGGMRIEEVDVFFERIEAGFHCGFISEDSNRETSARMRSLSNVSGKLKIMEERRSDSAGGGEAWALSWRHALSVTGWLALKKE